MQWPVSSGVGTLTAVMPVVGVAHRLGRLALALGYDVAEAFEVVGGDSP